MDGNPKARSGSYPLIRESPFLKFQRANVPRRARSFEVGAAAWMDTQGLVIPRTAGKTSLGPFRQAKPVSIPARADLKSFVSANKVPIAAAIAMGLQAQYETNRPARVNLKPARAGFY